MTVAKVSPPRFVQGKILVNRVCSPQAILAALLFTFVTLVSFLPLRTAILIGADEGFEAAKATLCLKGYKLYSDIWNDQPPLHTYLITKILTVLPGTMLGPRLLTVGFALLLLSAVFLLFFRYSGLRIAAVATFLLLGSPGFLPLASSCMLEIPALGTTLAALCILAFTDVLKLPRAEMLAGLLLGTALEIKLISAVMLPLCAALLWANRCKSYQRLMRTSAWFVGSALAGMIAADLVSSGGRYLTHFGQAWTSHFGGLKTSEFGSPNDHRFPWLALARNWDITVLALAGVVVCARRLSGGISSTLPLIWLTYSLLVFGLHRPWWNYYYVHTATPLCWCAAIGFNAAFMKARCAGNRLWWVVLGSYVVFGGGWIGERLWLEVQSVRSSPQTYSCLFLKEIQRYKPEARWLYSEEPIYSFYSDIPMPPDLAVLVLKRYWTGEMTYKRLTDDLRLSKPEIMLIHNDSSPRPFRRLLETEYRLIYMDSDNLLYAHKSIAHPSPHIEK